MKRDKDYFGIFNSQDRYDDAIIEETRAMLAECNDMKPEEVSDEWVDECIWDGLDDERMNLDVDVPGMIIALASVGTWRGKRQGYKVYGSTIADILHSECDDVEWFADRYNVHGVMHHHDGSNFALYRVAKDEEAAERIADRIWSDPNYTEADFCRQTQSLRPYVANVYGWKHFNHHHKLLKAA